MMSPMFIALFVAISVAQATQYDIRVTTSDIKGAGTDANVKIKIHGEKGVTSAISLDYSGRDDFEEGNVDIFVYSAEDVGVVTGFEVSRDNARSSPDWAFDKIGVKILSDPEYFTFRDWLPSNTWVKFPRPYCAEEGRCCYNVTEFCPASTKECVQYKCTHHTNKCCCSVFSG